MTQASRMPSPYGAPTLEQLTGLVFELASQLHLERARRIALEVALEDAGLLRAGAPDEAAGSDAMKARATAALDRSMSGIMRVLTESGDPRIPLRNRIEPDR